LNQHRSCLGRPPMVHGWTLDGGGEGVDNDRPSGSPAPFPSRDNASDAPALDQVARIVLFPSAGTTPSSIAYAGSLQGDPDIFCSCWEASVVHDTESDNPGSANLNSSSWLHSGDTKKRSRSDGAHDEDEPEIASRDALVFEQMAVPGMQTDR
jgi:hypothetical protein